MQDQSSQVTIFGIVKYALIGRLHAVHADMLNESEQSLLAILFLVLDTEIDIVASFSEDFHLDECCLSVVDRRVVARFEILDLSFIVEGFSDELAVLGEH